MTFKIRIPANFSFWRTVYSHGWCALPPFAVAKENKRIMRTIRLTSGEAFIVELYQSAPGALTLEIQGRDSSIKKKSQQEIIAQASACLRLDENFDEFYKEAASHPRFRWIPKIGAGRLLRAPEVFEDVVKMICTTNCSWALTEIMVQNLCVKLGTRLSETHHTFPRPEAIADRTERYLRKEIRAGYRALYLLEFSRRVVRGEIDPEHWRNVAAPTGELFREVRTIKGVGPYAAGNILKLLGRYDYLGIDSWCRKQFIEIHNDGKKTSDKAIERYYAPFGKWRGLFFWLDVTKHWYNKQFPF